MNERSKNAAKSRREKENAEFSQLAKLLPLPTNITAQMDKATIIRLTTSYLKLRRLFPEGLGGEWGSDNSSPGEGNLKEPGFHILKSISGFILVLSSDGHIIYVSETASTHLGLSQLDLMGNKIYDFIHDGDHEEMTQVLKFQDEMPVRKSLSEDLEVERSFCVRMKCILVKRNAGLVNDGYKIIHFSGYLKLRSVQLQDADVDSTAIYKPQVVGLVAIGHSLPPHNITEIRMSTDFFMSRASLDFTLLYLDSSVFQFTGYTPQQMIEKKLYHFVYGKDILQLQKDHELLIKKGQVVSKYYRLLTKGGGWIWIQSHCTVVHSSRTYRSHSLVALNYVLSGKENADVVMDRIQVEEHKYEINSFKSSCVENGIKRPRINQKNSSNVVQHQKRKVCRLESSYSGDVWETNDNRNVARDMRSEVNGKDFTSLKEYSEDMGSTDVPLETISPSISSNIFDCNSNVSFDANNMNAIINSEQPCYQERKLSHQKHSFCNFAESYDSRISLELFLKLSTDNREFSQMRNTHMSTYDTNFLNLGLNNESSRFQVSHTTDGMFINSHLQMMNNTAPDNSLPVIKKICNTNSNQLHSTIVIPTKDGSTKGNSLMVPPIVLNTPFADTNSCSTIECNQPRYTYSSITSSHYMEFENSLSSQFSVNNASKLSIDSSIKSCQMVENNQITCSNSLQGNHQKYSTISSNRCINGMRRLDVPHTSIKHQSTRLNISEMLNTEFGNSMPCTTPQNSCSSHNSEIIVNAPVPSFHKESSSLNCEPKWMIEASTGNSNSNALTNSDSENISLIVPGILNSLNTYSDTNRTDHVDKSSCLYKNIPNSFLNTVASERTTSSPAFEWSDLMKRSGATERTVTSTSSSTNSDLCDNSDARDFSFATETFSFVSSDNSFIPGLSSYVGDFCNAVVGN
ncbi:period circadian protein-like [Stegodyphus dumicola]|uniref:period circadian protein-like n=1 Tax=Stegodyphus dumicola TaxID=202533 RepID=UPI0015AD6FCE|nr:period circadian protein-like [Stegodyphus dumicola]